MYIPPVSSPQTIYLEGATSIPVSPLSVTANRDVTSGALAEGLASGCSTSSSTSTVVDPVSGLTIGTVACSGETLTMEPGDTVTFSLTLGQASAIFSTVTPPPSALQQYLQSQLAVLFYMGPPDFTHPFGSFRTVLDPEPVLLDRADVDGSAVTLSGVIPANIPAGEYALTVVVQDSLSPATEPVQVRMLIEIETPSAPKEEPLTGTEPEPANSWWLWVLIAAIGVAAIVAVTMVVRRVTRT